MPITTNQMPNEPTAQSWTSQGLTLNYFDWGNQDKPLLILLHGNGDHARSWDPTARVLSLNWHVIAPDLRGHGDSQWSPDGAYSTSYFAMDFADLIDHLGVEQASIVGHSYGGVITLRYAAMYPNRVRQLVVIDGHGPSEQVKKSWAETGATLRTREWIEKRRKIHGQSQRHFATLNEAADRLIKNNPRLSNTQAQELAHHGARRVENGFIWKRDPLIHAFTAEDFSQENASEWQHITSPAFFLYGKDSWKYHSSVQELEEHFPDASGEAIENAGHWLHHDQFDRFITLLQNFLTK